MRRKLSPLRGKAENDPLIAHSRLNAGYSQGTFTLLFRPARTLSITGFTCRSQESRTSSRFAQFPVQFIDAQFTLAGLSADLEKFLHVVPAAVRADKLLEQVTFVP